MVPCTLSVPLKFFGYMAIVCKAMLLLIPGRPSMALDVNVRGPPVPVNELTFVLAINSGYAPSISSIVPAAA